MQSDTDTTDLERDIDNLLARIEQFGETIAIARRNRRPISQLADEFDEILAEADELRRRVLAEEPPAGGDV